MCFFIRYANYVAGLEAGKTNQQQTVALRDEARMNTIGLVIAKTIHYYFATKLESKYP